MKALYTTFRLKGVNFDALINSLKRRGFTIYNAKKKGDKVFYFTVNKCDSEKVFAISKDLCYNIKKVKEGGLIYPLYYLTKNFGLTLGILFSIALVFISNDFIFNTTFTGSGAVYSRQVTDYLESEGVTRFSRFSQVDLDILSDKILEANPNLSFVSCVKNGNTLQIDCALLDSGYKGLSGKAESLISDAKGVIESIKVYRGNPLKSVGDSVIVGDVIVDGNLVIKEQELKVNVLAVCSIKAQFDYVYISEADGEEDYAFMLAESALNQEIIERKIQKNLINGKYSYRVSLFYRHVLSVG